MNKKEIDAFFTYLDSQQSAQKYLFHCYQKITGIDAETKSYENCNTFMYYLDHGRKFYENGKKLDVLLQPILFFYGMIHLLKACLLTKRPNYPESTSILAHGVSTRKRKKKQYTFMDDEVKVQHNGLFPYFSEHLFSFKSLPFEKVNMKQLLSLIPELSLLFRLHGEEQLVKVGKVNSTNIKFPIALLDHYHLTEKAFIHRINKYIPPIIQINTNQSTMHIEIAKPLTVEHGPFYIDLDNQTIHFPVLRENFLPISEVMLHYLLLYNLSMLSRYEAEWWGDLLVTKPELDYPFITYFLQNTAKKIPILLGNELYRAAQ